MKASPFIILYFGSNSPASTSRHRADALRRLGCEVTVVDPEELIGLHRRWQDFIDYRTGYRFLQRRLLRELKVKICALNNSPNLIWVNGGELLGPCIANWLRLSFHCKIILYQNDDPTGFRDGNRFLSLRSALPCYDLCFFVRAETALEALALGARRVLRVFMSYDEVLHTARQLTSEPHEQLQSVVSFVGTLIPGEPRDRFLAALIQAGIPLRLIGNSWQRSSLWPLLQTIFEGPGRTGSAYSHALRDAAVSLGFLSHQNRDLVTRRSVETPACGGLLCAERTSEHQLLYEDGWEAMFWDSVEECILQCNMLLGDPELRHKTCMNGAQHVREIGVGNEDICRQILASI
jgi:spore maturation protein CgeB